MVQQPLVGQGLLIIEVLQSLGHTTLGTTKRKIYPCTYLSRQHQFKRKDLQTKCKNILGFRLLNIPYILESNPHPVFGNFLNGKKKLVRDSNPHLSFNHPLPTGLLIE
jgi:hypothetical protein